MQDLFVGRQPIYTRGLEIFGYELLYRSGPENRAGVTDGDQATSRVIVNAFLEIGLEHVVGDRIAFLNLTRSFLLDGGSVPFPRDRVILEVLEDIEIDRRLLESVQALAGAGYRIALDDFVYRPQVRELLAVAEIVKLDVLALGRAGVEREVRQLREFPVHLLAEKVETREEFEYCSGLGFEYFQGYFLNRPHIVRGREIPANRLNALRLLARLQDPDAGAEEIERIVGLDVTLSYRLLRYINSAFFALPRKVDSIRQAVIYLGTRAIRTWVSLLVLAGLGDKPVSLMTTAMIRARMCELLAIEIGAPQPDTWFTVGLFSAVDTLMDLPMQEVLAQLPFTDDIVAALLRREGPIGSALRCALAYERGAWEEADFPAVAPGRCTELHLAALEWADAATRTLAAQPG